MLMRDYMMKDKKIKKEDGNLVFGTIRIPFSAPTAWVKSGVQREYYTIGALWVYLINSNEDLRKYAMDVKNYKVIPVSAPDKEIIDDYFRGKIDTVECIDEEFRPNTQISKHKRPPDPSVIARTHKHGEAMDVGEKEEKKELTEQEQILSYIANNEKRTATRHTQLQGSKVNA